MIVLLHSLCFVGRALFHILCDKLFSGRCFCNRKNVQLEPLDYKIKGYAFSKRYVNELKNCNHLKDDDLKCRFDEKSGLMFLPPVYSQRYNAIKESIVKNKWKCKLQKVVDIGCSELNFFPFLKNLPGVEEIIEVDIDAELLESVGHRVGPLPADHLANRTSPLHVLILAGSIGQHDPRLLGCDAVVAIELIEHLYPYDLEEVPFTIFGYIRPNVAFITTPNSDFNILFGQLRGFRHPDHKFEWSRMQFQDWAMNITVRFPDYEVEFQGIGPGPVGSEYLGCCSQMAIFTKKTSAGLTLHEGMQKTNNGNLLFQPESLNAKEVYKYIADFKYPVYVDNRTERQKLQDSASCVITNAASKIIDQRWNANQNFNENDPYSDQDYDEPIFISLKDILRGMDKAQLEESELSELLEGSGWNVKEVEGKLMVHYPSYEDQHSSIPEDEEIDDECSENVEYGPIPQNISPTPSCVSDWNEDTQARAYVDSGYPNSFSAHDKELANSIDLHGSSLEEDSGDDMEDDMENGVAAQEIQHGILPLQEEDMDNQLHFNAAAIPGLFYEEVGNQDENQDLVNNNRDNEGNNAEAVFGVEHREEDDVDEASESEESVVEQPSEEESELEDEKIGVMDEEEKLVERLIDRMELARRSTAPPRRQPPHLPPASHQQDVHFFHGGREAAGDIGQNILALRADDPSQDEGFAEAVASGSAVAVLSVDEAGDREHSSF